jgi:hypothetical protein
MRRLLDLQQKSTRLEVLGASKLRRNPQLPRTLRRTRP